MPRDVIVTAFRGRPVHMIEIARANNLVYVASRESLDRINAGASEPVGVPTSDVMEYDEIAFSNLRQSWEVDGQF